MKCEEKFFEIYGKEPEGLSFCPYRICPIGAHVDHNLGKITGIAIDKGIHIAFRPKQNGVVEMSSLQFPKRAQWHISEVGTKTGDWADYLRGVTLMLKKQYALSVGLCGVIEGSLPIGGVKQQRRRNAGIFKRACQGQQHLSYPSAVDRYDIWRRKELRRGQHRYAGSIL